MQHQFFQGFIPQQEQVKASTMTPELQHNLLVLEISNNWKAVKELVKRLHKEQEIQVHPMENDWLQFLNSNQIDLLSFENEDKFVDQHLKPLVSK